MVIKSDIRSYVKVAIEKIPDGDDGEEEEEAPAAGLLLGKQLPVDRHTGTNTAIEMTAAEARSIARMTSSRLVEMRLLPP